MSTTPKKEEHLGRRAYCYEPQPPGEVSGQTPRGFAKEDLIRFASEQQIEMVNFRYVAADDRLKTLNFVITSKADLDRLLSTGERVDGSSLFPYIDAASSDLYVIPRFKTAYVNPFSPIPTLDIMCSYYTRDGEPLAISPESIIRKAHDSLKTSTGISMDAMGELEYYVFCDRQDLYPATAQKGYHESQAFSKWESLRCEAMQAIAQVGGQIKYGHSEVGNIRDADREMEQNEIEFQPAPIEDAADQLVIAKWILRMIRRGPQRTTLQERRSDQAVGGGVSPPLDFLRSDDWKSGRVRAISPARILPALPQKPARRLKPQQLRY